MGRAGSDMCGTVAICGKRGYHGPDCILQYRWAVERLVQEFGCDAVRVGFSYDYGDSRDAGVSCDGWSSGVRLVLSRASDDGRVYDLNDHKSALDAFVERARPMFRGFGV